MRRSGRGGAAVAFHGHTDPRLGEGTEEIAWLHPGEVDAVVETLTPYEPGE